MLGKLLKYEIPAIGRKLGPMYIAWLAASVLLGLTLPKYNEANIMSLIPVLVYAGVTIAVFVMMIVMIIERYSSSLLGDEAYFNLSLPVSASEHIANKIISAALWTIITTLLAILSGLIIMTLSGIMTGVFSLDWSGFPGEMYPNIGFGKLILLVVEFIFLSMFSTVKSILAIYAAMSLGHLVKKYFIPASIAAYIGLMTVESMTANIFMIAGNLTGYDFQTAFGNVYSATQTVMVIGFIVTTLLSIGYFLICRYVLENKLNLA